SVTVDCTICEFLQIVRQVFAPKDYLFDLHFAHSAVGAEAEHESPIAEIAQFAGAQARRIERALFYAQAHARSSANGDRRKRCSGDGSSDRTFSSRRWISAMRAPTSCASSRFAMGSLIAP